MPKKTKKPRKKSSKTWVGEYFSQVKMPGTKKERPKKDENNGLLVDWDDEGF